MRDDDDDDDDDDGARVCTSSGFFFFFFFFIFSIVSFHRPRASFFHQFPLAVRGRVVLEEFLKRKKCALECMKGDDSVFIHSRTRVRSSRVSRSYEEKNA